LKSEEFVTTSVDLEGPVYYDNRIKLGEQVTAVG
jgi:hypothetical protein